MADAAKALATEQEAITKALELIAITPAPDDVREQLEALLRNIPEFMHDDLWEGLVVNEMDNKEYSLTPDDQTGNS
jgi:hypothetical protein